MPNNKYFKSKSKQLICFGRPIFVLLIIAGILLNPNDFQSAKAYSNQTFTQSDWSGNVSTSTAVYPNNDSGWGHYFSADSGVIPAANVTLKSSSTIDTLSPPLQLSAASTTQTSDTDFNAGAFTNVSLIGNASSASIILNSNWTQATSSAAWFARENHMTVAFSNKMWLMGGYNGSSSNDVWSSTDGITWTQATSSANWTPRTDFGALVFNNGSGDKMWIMGGQDYGVGDKNDVWSSTDGITWTQATSSANWSKRHLFGSAVLNGKIWVMGGVSGGVSNDVWSSTDGITWTQATSSANWSARGDFSSVVFNNKIWVMGGAGSTGNFNDVWSSTDGITWTQATSNANWSARTGFASVVFDNKMWIMGGYNGTAKLNDVWSSSDGVTWNEATASAGWETRNYFSSVVFNNKIWVMAGNSSLSYKNDIWSWDGSYSSSGNFVSGAINTGQANNFSTISWNASVPTSTTLKFQIATNNDNSTWNFLGPDGATSTYYTTSSATISSANNNSQYFKYKAYFSISISTSTPQLNDITINYRQVSSQQTSAAFNYGYQSNFSTISWNASVPTSTTLKFQIATNNDNSTWNFLGPDGATSTYYTTSSATISSANNGSQYLEYKAFISSTDPNSTPQLNSITIGSVAVTSTLASSVFNTTNPFNQINSISWSANNPTNTDVRFQMRSSLSSPGWSSGVSDTIVRMQLSNSGLIYNNKMYVFGGTNYLNNSNPAYEDLRAFDFNTQSWSAVSSDTVGGPKLASTEVIYNGKLYIFGGKLTNSLSAPYDATSSLRIYDFSTGIWSSGASDDVGGPRWVASVVIYNNKMYVFGGFSQTALLNDLRIYDFASNSWSAGASDTVGGGRGLHSAVVYNNKMYVFGGFNGASTLNDMRVYDFASNSWSAGVADSAGALREAHSAVIDSISGKMYVFGGFNRAGPTTLNDLRIFDFNTQTWSAGGLDTAGGGRRGVNMALYNGTIYIFGGNNGTSANYDDGTTLSDMRKYGIWSRWCGYLDCSGSTYFTSSNNGQALASNHPLRSGVSQYFEYQAVLSSSNAVVSTPTLSSVSIGFSFFDLVSPANNTSMGQTTQTFSWDSAPGANSYKIYLDNQLVGSTGSASFSTDISCGYHSWYVVATDGINNQQSVSQYAITRSCGSTPAAAYMAPSVPMASLVNPSGGFKIAINNGITSTNSNSVSLSLDGGPDAKMMVISEKPDFAGAGQMPYSTSTIFVLSQGKGEKTIYAKFYNSWGQFSSPISAKITLNSKQAIPAVSYFQTTQHLIQTLEQKLADLLQQLIILLKKRLLQGP